MKVGFLPNFVSVYVLFCAVKASQIAQHTNFFTDRHYYYHHSLFVIFLCLCEKNSPDDSYRCALKYKAP